MSDRFPAGHQAAHHSAIPGSSIHTDSNGVTTVTPPNTFIPSPVLADDSPTNLICPGSPGSPLSHIYFATYADPNKKIIHRGTVVICIDGGCTNNGTPSARAGLGVYFGPNSPLNLSERVEDGEQTSQRAELRAAVRALQQVRIALRDDIKTNKIVLLSDSQYLVDGITKFIHAWKENGWKGSDGKPVVNQKDFKELDELIPVLEEDGLNVEFWYASREYNRSADKLATEACAA